MAAREDLDAFDLFGRYRHRLGEVEESGTAHAVHRVVVIPKPSFEGVR